MESIETWLPSENIARDRETLVGHGLSEWSYHNDVAMHGAVLYPRSTEDVVKIVKLASLHAIPLVPFSGGTSLEGHFSACPTHSNPAEHVATALASEGKPISPDSLVPGLGWSLDFAEMGAIISVNAGDLDIVVQPGLTYGALNEELKERGIPLFFPVDPAPGAMIGGMISTGAR